MVKSLGSFIIGILKKIYWLLPSLLSDPFDIAERWFGKSDYAPQWLFWVLFGLGLFIASFLTYNDVKKKLDETKEAFYFEPTGNSVTTKTGSVLLNVSFRAKHSVIVDKLQLEIKGLRIAPLNWIPFKVSPQYTNTWTFDLAGKVNQGETYTGKLIATIDTKEHESREFEVYV